MQNEQPTHIVDFKEVSVFNVFFVSDFFGNGDPALHTYADGMLGHEYLWELRLYGFVCTMNSEGHYLKSKPPQRQHRQMWIHPQRLYSYDVKEFIQL